MGQQQLLLLILTIVVVMIAVAFAIDIFDETTRNSHIDALVSYSTSVASEAIAWKNKKSPFLGGGGSYSDLATNGLEKLVIGSKRPPGNFSLTDVSDNAVAIVAVSNAYPEIGVRVDIEGVKIVNTTVARDSTITLP